MRKLVTPSALVSKGPYAPDAEEPDGKLTFKLVTAAVILLTEKVFEPVKST